MELTFEVAVTSTDNHTWQGTLRGCGEDFPFQSELELLFEMARRIDPEGFACPAWRPAEGDAE